MSQSISIIIDFIAIYALSFVVITHSTLCDEAHECASLNISESGSDIRCNAFGSCQECPLIESINAPSIACRGSYSCYKAGIIQHTTSGTSSFIDCGGLMSCAMTKHYIKNELGNIVCRGELSCLESIISRGNTGVLYCMGDRSCKNSTIYGGNENVFLGHLAAQNAVIYNNQSFHNWFYGTESGKGVTLICDTSQMCNVTCAGYAFFS